MPLEDQWQELDNLRNEHTLFIWEAQPDAAIADRMIALDLPFVVIKPGASRSEQDWLAVQRENQSRLKAYILSSFVDLE